MLPLSAMQSRNITALPRPPRTTSRVKRLPRPRTEQQKEIDEAIANGTWGIEYTAFQKQIAEQNAAYLASLK